MSEPNKPRYFDEKLTDNSVLNHYSQCERCVFRYKDHFEFAGKRYSCEEKDGWKKGNCHMFTYPEQKPNEVYNNTGMCEYYEVDK